METISYKAMIDFYLIIKLMYHFKENNFYSVVAKTNAFLPTNKMLTYQHETKKNTKKTNVGKTPDRPSFFHPKQKPKILLATEPLPHTATPDTRDRQLHER
jgi:hypothetical protein